MTSPAWTRRSSTGPTLTSGPRTATPEARRWRVAPRRTSSAQVTPLPHSGWAWVTPALTFTLAETGLCQPTTACRVGEGCTATPCGFMLPGTRTCWSDELARRFGNSPVHQPLTKSYPATFSVFSVRWPTTSTAPPIRCRDSRARRRARPARPRDARRARPRRPRRRRRPPRPPRRGTSPPRRRRAPHLGQFAAHRRMSRKDRSGRPVATIRGFCQTAKSCSFPSPASPAAR